ncbi:MAG: conserved hypothetical protein [Methanobrevibacter sp. CfCl-M3]
MKNMRTDVMSYLKKNKVSEFTFIATVHDLTRLNEILRSYDYEEALSGFKLLLDDFNDLEPVLQDIIVDSIIPNFERLTRHAKLNLIPRTSNQAEQGYSITNPKEIKKL